MQVLNAQAAQVESDDLLEGDRHSARLEGCFSF
jgi:hypothetical protein